MPSACWDSSLGRVGCAPAGPMAMAQIVMNAFLPQLSNPTEPASREIPACHCATNKHWQAQLQREGTKCDTLSRHVTGSFN